MDAGSEVDVLALPAADQIRILLERDGSRLGDIYRWELQGLTKPQMRDLVGAKDTAFIYSYEQIIDAALHGTVRAGGPTARRALVGALNSLIKKARAFPLSAEAIHLLSDRRALVEASTEGEDEASAAAAEQEEREYAAQTLADLEGVAGVYVFSYGWYLEHPADESRDTTFFKVGRAVDVASRIREHMGGARTHMPEPLALVRVYSAEGIGDRIAEVERKFHRLLTSAGHANPRWAANKRVGKEWFLTNTDFLDSIADVLGLRTMFIGQSEFVEET
ncbi:MAG: GIY-YIG nuclease family protein [Microbacteriaceae bacterium]|nr:MAG: GIY-YIG nuclease family protein [Microbacteriaceae bacterium]